MDHDFSEGINRAQQYLDNTFTDVFSHVNLSRVKPTSRIQLGEGYRQSDTKQAEVLQYSKEEIEIQTVLAEKELSRQIKALEEQVQQRRVKLNTMSKSIKKEVESSSSSDGAKYQRQSAPKPKLEPSPCEIGADLWKQLRRVAIPYVQWL
ncbi:Hypothetical predicted protein [Paramuricea clavata]|uniref:Uncharacterized protein n=1 Tax=Paramuricea clavata TaxID=317549 RepID=A0A6S7GLI1_PARCT|nr:Hypothetical predicted protein [Paramuricea clavata]